METKDRTDNLPDGVKKRRSTFAILFYINRTKVRKDGLCQLLCKVSIDGQSAQIGTKVTLDPSIWNPATGRAEGRSQNALTVNRAIDKITQQIEEHYKRINADLGYVTAELVKNALKGIAQKPLTLLALFREHNEEFHKRVGIDRTTETYDSYVNSYNHLLAFVQKKYGDDVTLRSLDMEFYDAFDLFLRTERGLQQKAVHEHLYRLKKMTKRAVSQGTLRIDPYCRQHPALPKSQSRHLKLEDLKTIMEQPVGKRNLQRVRDWFIFCTFTGLCYADLRRLSEKHIAQDQDGAWWIHIDRRKTKTPSAIPLLDIPLRIIEKYRPERKTDKIFNIYCRDYMHKLLKRLGKEYGIYLTFHKARHNFGTHIALSLGVPLETVSKMMGHTRFSTTQIYARVTDKKVEEDMKRLKLQTAGKDVNLLNDATLQAKIRYPKGKTAGIRNQKIA